MKIFIAIALALTLVGCGGPPVLITSPEQKAFMYDCAKHSRWYACEQRWKLLQDADRTP